MRTLDWRYNISADGGCGPESLAQLTNASDAAILSACCHHGYDPASGGMSPPAFKAAGRTLGIKFGNWLLPKRPTTLAELAAVAKRDGRTFAVGVKGHVLIIKRGEVLDVGRTPGDARVLCALEVKGRAQ